MQLRAGTRGGVPGGRLSDERALTALLGLGALLAALVTGYAMSRYGAMLVGMGIVALLVAGWSVLRVEVAFGVVFVAAIIAPTLIGYGGWTPALMLVIGVVALREVLEQRPIVLWAPLVVYCGVYVLTAAHGEWSGATIDALGKFLLLPAFALATAAAAREGPVRKNLLIMLFAAVSFQIVVSTVQALRGIQQYGRSEFEQFGDYVTGTLGSSASGLVTLVAVAAATVAFALALERVWKPKLLMALAIALTGVGVVSVARAVFVFVPVAFGAVLLAGGFFARRSLGLSRVVGVATVAIALTPGLVLGMQALYPGVTQDIGTVDKLREYLFLNTANSGPTPGRASQLQIAVTEVKQSGTRRELILGQGVGTTWLEADPKFSSSDENPVILQQRQFTNSVWVPRLLIETGLLGMAAFLFLLTALVDLARRARARMPGGTLDSGLILALPGLAALTFVSAFYLPVLTAPAYATAFWMFVGVCLAIARSRRAER